MLFFSRVTAQRKRGAPEGRSNGMKNAFMLGAALMFVIGADAQNNYTVTNIVTTAQDSRLINPWGLSRPSKTHFTENEWWVNSTVTGLSTLYDASVAIINLSSTISSA